MKPKNPQGGPDRPERGGGIGVEREREQQGGRERQPSEGGDVETGSERERQDQPAEEETEE